MEVIGKLLNQVPLGTEWELQGGKCRLGKEPNKSSEFSLQKETKRGGDLRLFFILMTG